MELPSERFRAGDPRPIGFDSELGPTHVDGTIAALDEIAEAVTMPPTARAKQVSVCLTSAAFMPGLPFNLYGFAIQAVDDEGLVSTDVATSELLYAITANQPVDLQRETAISFFFQLLGRYELVESAMQDRETFVALPTRAGTVDEERLGAATSQLRGNWQEAVQSLQAEASAAGVRLVVRYRPDPLPSRDEVSRRFETLRRAYNELELVRDAIDRAVAVIAGVSWRMTGGDEEIRRNVQQQLETMEITRYFSQALRDAYVCGNGYLHFSRSGNAPAIRALRPEAVEIRDDRYVEWTASGERDITKGTIHQKGMRQLRSPYGISPLELALGALRTYDNLTEFRENAERLRRRGLLVEQLKELQQTEDVAEASHDQLIERLRPVFAFFRESFGPPPADLYFPGQERIT